MTGSLRRIRHCSPRRTPSTWVPPARQRRGNSSPEAADSPPSRIVHRDPWNARPRTRRLGFPWNSPGERVSRGRRCMNGIRCSRRHPQETGASQCRHLRPSQSAAGSHMFPEKPRGTEARTDSASTRVHTSVDNHSPLEKCSPQSCTQRWTSSVLHSGLHRWHGIIPRYEGDAGLGRGLRREEEDRCVHTACTERS